MKKQPILFAGSSHLTLAKDVCKELKINLGRMELNQFPAGETNIQVLENVRGCDVFILQSTKGKGRVKALIRIPVSIAKAAGPFWDSRSDAAARIVR
ncbi:MAG TPA: ribose-phosphate pyrophosphokinase-like domain-containing protein [Waddliaceae bacterium]